MESKLRASRRQFCTLLEFMERHSEFAKSQPGHRGLVADRLWRKLANTLNSCDFANKTPEKWKKVWVDWKSNTKRKAFMIQQCRGASTVVGRTTPTLTKMEMRLLKLIGVIVEDHSTAEVQVSPRLYSDQVASDSETEMFVENETIPLSSLPQASHSNSRLSPAALSQNSETSRSPQRHYLSVRQRQTNGQLSELSIEHRRLRVDEMRERNEARRLKLDAERNVALSRIADIAQAFFDQYMHNNMPKNEQHCDESE